MIGPERSLIYFTPYLREIDDRQNSNNIMQTGILNYYNTHNRITTQTRAYRLVSRGEKTHLKCVNINYDHQSIYD